MTPYDHRSYHRVIEKQITRGRHPLELSGNSFPTSNGAGGAGPAPYGSGQAFFLISKGYLILNTNYKIFEIEKNFTIDIQEKKW